MAINNGDNAYCQDFFAIDQRYYYRTDGICDIGAYENNSALANRGTLSFTTEISEVNEQEEFATVVVSRTGGSDTAIAVNIIVSGEGIAEQGEDFEYKGELLTWADGNTENKTVQIPIKDNTLKSENKIIEIQLATPSTGVSLSPITTHEITILDDESLPGIIEFGSSSFIIDESQQFVYLKLIRKYGSSGEMVVDVTTRDGSAIADNDYAGGTAKATFRDGEAEINFFIEISDGWDDIYDQDKVFYVSISSSNEKIVGDLITTSVIIIDDEAKPKNPGDFSFEFENYTVNEDTSTLNININRNNGADGNAIIYLLVNDETAKFSSDIIAIDNDVNPKLELHFPAGKKSLSITLSINNDLLHENDETLTLALLNPLGGAGLGENKVTTVTIVDNDTPKAQFSFEKASYSIFKDAKYVEIELVRSGDTSGNASVTVSNNPTNDFSSLWKTEKIQFIDGQKNHTIKINISDANIDAPDGEKAFTLKLSTPINSELGNIESTIITIVDSDSAEIKSDSEKELSTSKGAGSISWSYFLFAVLFLTRKYTFRKLK